ncbi:MAG TPA: hypothetical protein VJP85_00210 [Candidatus Baltobacteraceae bacterium]|nr:hypothetical protein [Candidatus Baltobacteraceae bacterium]
MTLAVITLSPEWITAWATVALVAVGFFGLRSLSLSTRALAVEISPVIVIESAARGEQRVHDVSYDIQLDDAGKPILKERANDAAPQGSPGSVVAAAYIGADPRPRKTLVVRNVGRAPAVGLRLLGYMNVGGASGALAITLPVVPAGDNDKRRILLRNNTTAPANIFFSGIAHHQPEDAPGFLYLRGYLAIRSGFVRLPGLARTPLYKWLVERQKVPHRRVYVYSAGAISLRGAGQGEPSRPGEEEV